MTSTMRHLISLAVAVVMAAACTAQAQLQPQTQADTCPRWKHLVNFAGLNVRPLYIVQDNNFLKGENEDNRTYRAALEVHGRWGFRFNPRSDWGRKYPDTYQGVGVGVSTFFCPAGIGTPFSLYAFQGSTLLRFGERVTIDNEWNFGVSGAYMHSDDRDPSGNRFIGTDVNAYLSGGILVGIKLSNCLRLRAGFEFTHRSNGFTAFPNHGLNTLGARIGIEYLIDHDSLPAPLPPLKIKRHFEYNVMAYGAWHQKGTSGDSRCKWPAKYGVAGLQLNPMYVVSRYWAFGASMDFQYDAGANKFRHVNWDEDDNPVSVRERTPFMEKVTVGLSLRAELRRPIFTINAGFGWNVVAQGGSDTRGLYHVLSVKTYLTRRLYLNTGYYMKNTFGKFNLMLGLGYRFGATD